MYPVDGFFKHRVHFALQDWPADIVTQVEWSNEEDINARNLGYLCDLLTVAWSVKPSRPDFRF
jgi:hypothetical protein